MKVGAKVIVRTTDQYGNSLTASSLAGKKKSRSYEPGKIVMAAQGLKAVRNYEDEEGSVPRYETPMVFEVQLDGGDTVWVTDKELFVPLPEEEKPAA